MTREKEVPNLSDQANNGAFTKMVKGKRLNCI